MTVCELRKSYEDNIKALPSELTTSQGNLHPTSRTKSHLIAILNLSSTSPQQMNRNSSRAMVLDCNDIHHVVLSRAID